MAEIRKGYKQTEIGVIPEDWKVKKLGEVGSIKSSKRVYKNDYVSEGVPFYRSKEIIELSKNINPSIELFIERSRYNKFKDKYGVPTQGDLMITSVGTIGKVWISDGREFYYKDGNLTQFTSKDQIKIDFVKALFNSSFLEKQYLGQSYGSAQVALTINKLNNLKIPIPPLKEQEKIAEILSTTDKHIEDLDRLIEDYELLKKGMMQKLLTEGIGHTEFKDTEIGRIPKGWEVRAIEEIGTLAKGKGIGKNEIRSEGLPCIRYGEIYTDYNYYVVDTKSFINEKSARESTQIKKGEIIFAGSGETIEEIGKAIVYLGDSQCYVGGDTIILRPIELIDSLYLSYFISSMEVRKQTRKYGQGSSIIHIYKEGVGKINVALPPLDEQEKIASILSSIDTQINQLKETKDNYTNLKQALMDRLLTGNIRVV